MNGYDPTLLAPIKSRYQELGKEVKTELDTLVAKATSNFEITEPKVYQFSSDGPYFQIYKLIITLYPNGTCEIHDTIRIWDDCTGYEAFGIYNLTDKSIEMDLVYTLFYDDSNSICKISQDVDTVNYTFEKNLEKDEFICNSRFKLDYDKSRQLPINIPFIHYKEKPVYYSGGK